MLSSQASQLIQLPTDPASRHATPACLVPAAVEAIHPVAQPCRYAADLLRNARQVGLGGRHQLPPQLRERLLRGGKHALDLHSLTGQTDTCEAQPLDTCLQLL